MATEGLPLVDAEGRPTPMFKGRPLGFGVLNGDVNGRVGELCPSDVLVGEGIDRTGLAEPRVGELDASRGLNFFAVILAYCDVAPAPFL